MDSRTQPGYSNFEMGLLDEDTGVQSHYNPLADVAGQTAGFITEVRYKKVKTRCCLCSCSCCWRWTLYFIFVVLVAVASTVLITIREFLFEFDSDEEYYFSDVDNYLGFLAWGDPGTDDLMLNTSSSALQHTHGGMVTSVDGWANLCPNTEMGLFVQGGRDDLRCSYSNPAGYLQGCAEGFYQPEMDEYQTAQACPEGFFCPFNFACTIACVPGSQCFNSTFEASTGTCRFPKTMLGASSVEEPLEVALRSPNTAAPTPTPAPSYTPSLQPLMMPTQLPTSSPPPSDDGDEVVVETDDAAVQSSRLLSSPSSSSPVSWLIPSLKATTTHVWHPSQDAKMENEAVHDNEGVGDASALTVPLPPRELNQDHEAISTALVCPGAGNMFLCNGGFYCPNAVTFIPCPEGYYCPVGSIGPKPCAAIASCNFKAAYPDYREQVVEISVLLIGVFVVCLKCFRKVRHHLREKRRQKKLAADRLLHRRRNSSALTSAPPGSGPGAHGNDSSKAPESGNRASSSFSEVSLLEESGGGGSSSDSSASMLESFGFPHGGSSDLEETTSPSILAPFPGRNSSNHHIDWSRSNSPDALLNDSSSATAIEAGGTGSLNDGEPLQSLRDKRDTMIELAFVRLGLVLRSNGAKVLNGVTGRCRPGRVTAIMGPSGAGKTTLMNTLAGRATYGKRFGTLLVNGVVDSIVSYSDLVGFVPQDDIMHDDLSVKENLTMYAGLRLPATLNRQQRLAVVKDVMAVLEIDRIAHSVVGNTEKRGISGGQRKRVNIAMEMVADPSLLFLDEPTSGLDSTTSFAVIGALRELSRKGANVIAVLHQPSYQIFEMFDDVIFLARGGFSVYVGPAKDASRFFTDLGFDCPPLVNPADFFMDVIAGKYPRAGDPSFTAEDLIALWAVCEDEQSGVNGQDGSSMDTDLQPVSLEALRLVKPAGFWRSLRFFVRRAITQQLRASQQLLADTVLESFAGCLVGVLYPHLAFADLAGFMSFMCLALGLTISIASLRVFGNERVVFWREAAPGSGMRLDKFSYFMAKNLVELPRLIVLCFFFTMAFYPIVTPNVEWAYVWAYCCAAAFACSGLAYCASIALSPLKAQLLVVIYVLVAIMFSGLATRLDQLENNPLFVVVSYLSFARWQAELVYLQTVWSLTLAWRMPPPFYAKSSKYSALAGLIGLRYTPLDVVFALNVSMLILLGITFRVFAFVSLVAFNRDKRGLPTLAQMSLYWIVNPLDDWARARGEQQELRSRRARIQSRSASSARGSRSRTNTGGETSHDDDELGRRSGSRSGEGDSLVSSSRMNAHNSSDDPLRMSGGNSASQRSNRGYAAPASSGYDLYPELDYQASSEEL